MWRKNRGLWTVYFGGGATSARGKLEKHLLSWMGDSQEITVYGTRIKRLHNEQSNSLSFIAFSVQFLFCKYPFLECPHQKRFYWSKKFVAKHFVDITICLSEANDLSPWVPETFSSAVSRFFLAASANTENSRRTREKPLVPKVMIYSIRNWE